MTILGINLPNRRLTADDLDRLLALELYDYVLYLYEPADADYWVGVCTDILRRQPSARIHLRLESRGELGDPLRVARDAAGITARFGQFIATVRWGNERNVESPGVSPAEYCVWLAAFGRELKRLRPGVAVYAPAVSPGTEDWLDWWWATCDAADVAGLDGADGHAYGSVAEVADVLGKLRQRWPGRLLVTEYNPGAGHIWKYEDWAADLPVVASLGQQFGVEAVCLFIWEWDRPTDEAGRPTTLPVPVDVKGTVVEQAMLAMKGVEPVGLKEQYPQLWAEWVKAGGDVNNFRKHLLGLGILKPTREDVIFLADELIASANQVKGAVSRLPL